jgi:glyoxylate reductase
MTLPLVYVARRIPDVGLQQLRQVAQLRIHQGDLPPTRSELFEGVAGCHGLLSLLSDRIDGEVFDAAGSQLKVVGNFAVGFNNIDVNEARQRGIAVGNTPDVLTDATADIAVALLLSVARQLAQAASAVEKNEWKTWEPLGWIGLDLKGKTLGIVGMGRIGTAVAQRLHGGWNMRVIYSSRQSKPDVDRELRAEHVDLQRLLRESDFVSVHTPLNSETQALLGAEEFGLMKPTCVLVNTSRGEILDQAALAVALERRLIFAAGLDVCVPEPLLADSPLRKLDNCYILPHIGSATVEARDAMSLRAAQNIMAGLRGQPLPFPVN